MLGYVETRRAQLKAEKRVAKLTAALRKIKTGLASCDHLGDVQELVTAAIKEADSE